MKKSEQQKSTIERQFLLAELIQSELKKKPGASSIILGFSLFFKRAHFTDIDLVDRYLNQLKKALVDDFNFSVLSEGKALSVVDTNPHKLPQVPYAYKITLEDRRALAAYITGLKEKLKVDVKSYHFLMTKLTENASALILVGSQKKPIELRHHSRRYKILHYLAEKKTKVQTRVLADKFEMSEVDVRDAITEVKARVKKAFGIPSNAIFDNDQTGDGYSVANVQVK